MSNAIQSWIDCPKMSHEEWLEWRRTGVGGSDAPAIMHVSPWSTPFQKWEEKVMDKKQAENSAMRFGRDSEEASRREYETMVGVSMFPLNVENSQYSWLHASLDGIDLNGDKIVEIKKANREDHFVAVNGMVPDKYIPQCQHILKVMGKDVMDYFSSPSDGSKGVIVEVCRDSSYIDEDLFPRVQKFWDMVLNKIPPELTEKDYQLLSLTAECQKKAHRLLEIRGIRKTLEKEDEEILEYLKADSQGRSAQGHGVRLQKQICMGAIDYSRVPILEGVDLNPYRKKSFEKWTVRAI
jgi:putative phage-type endonuclease